MGKQMHLKRQRDPGLWTVLNSLPRQKDKAISRNSAWEINSWNYYNLSGFLHVSALTSQGKKGISEWQSRQKTPRSQRPLLTSPSFKGTLFLPTLRSFHRQTQSLTNNHVGPQVIYTITAQWCSVRIIGSQRSVCRGNQFHNPWHKTLW